MELCVWSLRFFALPKCFKHYKTPKKNTMCMKIELCMYLCLLLPKMRQKCSDIKKATIGSIFLPWDC